MLALSLPGELPMLFRVDLLQIEDDQTGGLHQPVEGGPIFRVIGPEGLARRIQRRMHALGAGQRKEGRQKVQLPQRFAAADGDAAFFAPVIAVAVYFLE